MPELDTAVSDGVAELTNVGILAVREDLNLEPCFWAQLPGNFRFHRAKGATLETTSATPYAFNFHHGDLGNFTVIAPSGSGKTVALSFLLAQAQRFAPRSVLSR